MKLFKINQEKCTRCGLCAEVCPTAIITVGEDGPIATGRQCIACGHCSAVCPQGALEHRHTPLANQPPIQPEKKLSAASAAQFLRSRRSIRCYRRQSVPHDKVRDLLDMARLAPTGSNAQGLSYLVIDQTATLEKITEAVITWMELEIRNKSSLGPYFVSNVKAYRETGRDVILRNAPTLVIALAKKTALSRSRDNTHFSLAYAELYAPTLGLGTCWAGFFEACAATGYPPLISLLEIPENLAVTGAIMVGYPKYTYQRLVDRNPLEVTFQQASAE